MKRTRVGHVKSDSGLGYDGSESLTRTADGIAANINSFFGLINYPVQVHFTKNAARRMDSEYKKHANCSTIKVGVELSDGKEMDIFSINTDFFGRVQRDMRQQGEDYSGGTYEVNTAKYDATDESFEQVRGCERSFSFFNHKSLSHDVTVKSFIATYLLGYSSYLVGVMCPVSSMSSFVLDVVNSPEFTEHLELNVDVDDHNEWKLQGMQKS